MCIVAPEFIVEENALSQKLWGVTMLTLGLLVVADGYLQIVRQSEGTFRGLYIALGVLLFVRGLILFQTTRKKSKAREPENP